MTDDATPEVLAVLLSQQGGRMLVTSDEGAAFEIAKGRYGEGPNFEVWLKSHSGSALRVDRIGRDPLTVKAPAITAVMAVQPDVIRGLADRDAMCKRGFPQRWLYGVPVEKVGHRDPDPPPAPDAVAEAYRASMLRLWRLPAAPTPVALTFAPEAVAVMVGFLTYLEPRLRVLRHQPLLKGWVGKLAGAAARIAAICHIAGGASAEQPVTEAAATNAAELARAYLLPHAEKAFGIMGADPRVNDAQHVLRWVRANHGPANSRLNRRELYRGLRGRWASVADMGPTLQLLEDHHYLRSLPQAARPGPGRKPSPEYLINPLTFAGD
jgi:hypothetical protein